MSYSSWRANWKCMVPDFESGDLKLETFEIGKDDFYNWKAGARATTPGKYKRLLINGRLFMSDTDAEYSDHTGLFREAEKSSAKSALIYGLGLGLCLRVLLEEHPELVATVIEINENVVSTIGKWFEDTYPGRVQVIQADGMTWIPPKGQKWDLGWYDIWPDLCTDNLGEVAVLKRRFSKRCKWQAAWGEELLRSKRRQEARQEKAWSWG